MNYVVSADGMKHFPVGPAGSHASIFNGEEHGIPAFSLMLAKIFPGEGPAWHRHSYDEAFVIAEGTATFTIGEDVVEASPGQVVLIPAGIPHSFVNSGEGMLRQTAVHASPSVTIEWLEAPVRKVVGAGDTARAGDAGALASNRDRDDDRQS
jgi:mannose-6-phosphate isomerase-like protein (cupin superfamily)